MENNKTYGDSPVFAKAAFANEYVIDAPQEGLTKREYFAAMAMQGLLANYGSSYSVQNTMEAVYMADALIEELNKPKTNEK